MTKVAKAYAPRIHKYMMHDKHWCTMLKTLVDITHVLPKTNYHNAFCRITFWKVLSLTAIHYSNVMFIGLYLRLFKLMWTRYNWIQNLRTYLIFGLLSLQGDLKRCNHGNSSRYTLHKRIQWKKIRFLHIHSKLLK
jgi:hypothetical protein